MTQKDRMDLLKSFGKDSTPPPDQFKDMDFSAMMNVNEELKSLKENKSIDALDRLLSLKSSIEKMMDAAPMLKSMLSPNLQMIDKGIAELTNNK
jgi:hypothetical protein